MRKAPAPASSSSLWLVLTSVCGLWLKLPRAYSWCLWLAAGAVLGLWLTLLLQKLTEHGKMKGKSK